MWIFKNKNYVRILSLVLITVMLTSAFCSCKGKKEEETTTEAPTTEVPTTAAPVIRNPITGEPGYDKSLKKNRPVVISVENHPSARPQWGLCSSDLVMEMVAEGGITRMLLMYADKSRIPEKVGPVRSARHYFIELVTGFDAIFVHWGGSTYAYNEFNKGYCDHLDGRVISSCFFRDKTTNRALEHTGYTTGSSIVSTIESKDLRTKLNDGYASPFKFKSKNSAPSKDVCTSCEISFSQSYNYTYKYDTEKKVYFSSLNGSPFKDSDGNQQNFTNLLIIYTKITDLNDSKNRVTFDLSSGHGIYVSEGAYKEIKWEKGSHNDMLKFYDENGKELKLNAGRTYIGILGTGRESYTKIS